MNRFSDIGRVLWRGRKLVVAFTTLLLCVVWVSMWASAPLYRAIATVIVSPDGERPWHSGSQDDLFTDSERFRVYETQRKVVRKRVVLDLAAAAIEPTPFASVFGEDLVQGLFAASSVKLIPDTEILEISCEHADPIASQVCANAIAEAYQQFVRIARALSGVQRHEMLQQNAEGLRQQWQTASNALEELKVTVGGDSGIHAISAHLHRLQQLQGRLRLDVIQASQYGQTLRGLSASLGTEAVAHALSGVGVVDDALGRLQEARLDLTQASARYERAHPKLLRARQVVSAGEVHLEQVVDAAFRGLDVDSMQVSEELNSFGVAVKQQSDVVHQVSDGRLQLMAAKVELEKVKRLSNVVEEQMIVTSLETMMPTLIVQLIDEATRPTEVVSPNPVQSSLSALLFGLLGGSLLVLCAEWVNPRVRSVVSSEAALGYPPIASIPLARLEEEDAPPVVTMLSRSAGVIGIFPVDDLWTTCRASDLLVAHGATAGFRGISQILGNASGLTQVARLGGVVLVATVDQTSQEKLVQVVVELIEATGVRPDIILVT
jgi:capsular polysaccharide biosynthesis protein